MSILYHVYLSPHTKCIGCAVSSNCNSFRVRTFHSECILLHVYCTTLHIFLTYDYMCLQKQLTPCTYVWKELPLFSLAELVEMLKHPVWLSEIDKLLKTAVLISWTTSNNSFKKFASNDDRRKFVVQISNRIRNANASWLHYLYVLGARITESTSTGDFLIRVYAKGLRRLD